MAGRYLLADVVGELVVIDYNTAKIVNTARFPRGVVTSRYICSGHGGRGPLGIWHGRVHRDIAKKITCRLYRFIRSRVSTSREYVHTNWDIGVALVRFWMRNRLSPIDWVSIMIRFVLQNGQLPEIFARYASEELGNMEEAMAEPLPPPAAQIFGDIEIYWNSAHGRRGGGRLRRIVRAMRPLRIAHWLGV